MFNPRKRFSIESLEARQMMAGDLAAYVMNGNLYISEAAGQTGLDNGVRVAQLANGMIRVEGAEANSPDNDKSLINGMAYQDFMVPGDLIVKLGAGSDRIHLGYDGGVGAPTFNNININMAAPELVITQKMAAMKLTGPSVFNVPDDDQVMGWGFTSRGMTNINTGAGSDWVFIGRSYIGDGYGGDNENLIVNTGAGADGVTIKGASIQGGAYFTTYKNVGENDSDNVWFDSTFDANFNVIPTYIRGNSEIYMGGGDDYFFVSDPSDEYFFGLSLQTLGSMHLSTGNGNDLIDIAAARFGDANHWSNLSIYAAGGADNVSVDFGSSLIEIGQPSPELSGALFISAGYAGENDADIVTIPVAQVGSMTHVYLGGGNDTFNLMAGNWGYDLTVDAGAGNDTGYVAGFLYDDVFLRMGEGDDNLTLGHVNCNALNLDGGAGVDRLRKEAYLAIDHLYETGWEYINGRHTWWDDIIWRPTTGGVFMP